MIPPLYTQRVAGDEEEGGTRYYIYERATEIEQAIAELVEAAREFQVPESNWQWPTRPQKRLRAALSHLEGLGE